MSHHTKAERSWTMTREFDAPRESVWKAFTNPQVLAQWYAPEPMTVPRAEADLRPGGRYTVIMRDQDGTEYTSTGEYREIVEPERLVYTDSVEAMLQDFIDQVNAARHKAPGTPVPDGVVTVTFEDTGAGKTKITYDVEYDSKATVNAYKELGMVEGLEGSWANLDKVLAKMPSVAP